MGCRRLSDSKRHIWNIWMFILSFALSNLISGVVYDVYINYLQDVARPIATSFWSYYGYATFISASLVLLVNRIGYKWTLLICPVTCFAAFMTVLYVDIPVLYQLTSILVLVGLQLHYAILAPFIAAHTSLDNKTLWYSRTYWIGYGGWVLMTYFGGFLTVARFASRLGETFEFAKAQTKFIETFSPQMKAIYIASNQDVLVVTAAVAAVSIIPVLLIREHKEDYNPALSDDACVNVNEQLKGKVKLLREYLMNRYVVSYIVYWALINFGMGLFTPYFSVFLNRSLHMDRVTASLLVSLSHVALVLFMMFTPRAVKKFGQIITLAGVSLISIPFMIMIANGDKFGVYAVPVVGFALFMRSGFMNLGYPIDSALPMEIVPSAMRPVMSFFVNSVAGLSGILSGWYTGNVLFVAESGYRNGYYIAAVCYLAGCMLLLVVFSRRFNRSSSVEQDCIQDDLLTEEAR